MVLDPSIPLQTRSFDTLGMLENGSRIAQQWQQQNTDKELGRIYNEAQGDLSKMMELGKQSKMARFVMPQLAAQQSAQDKAVLDQQKSIAEISKTNSEAFKNTQQGGEYGANTSQIKLGALNQAIIQGAQSGDKSAVLLGLLARQQAGLISSEDLSMQTKLIQAMEPEELKQYASNVAFAGAKDPASLMFTDANTLANNAQSDINNQRTTNASIYGTDVAANTADKNRAQQQQQFDANAYIQQNKPLDYFTAADGTRYAVYANGQGIPVSNAQGTPIKAQQAGSMNSTIQGAILDTDDKVSSTKNAIINLKDALKYSEKAYDGVGATQRATARGFLGEDERATSTTMLDNIVTGNAIEMLKSTFGAAPTEGERAILMQLQGSANLPRAQREAIYTRAIQMAEARLTSNQQKANELRGGTYFSQQQGIPYANAGQQPQSTFNLFD